MATGTDWFDRMTTAIKERERALSGLERWQEKVALAETAIAALTAERDRPDQMPSPAQLAMETNELPTALRPIFGSVANA